MIYHSYIHYTRWFASLERDGGGLCLLLHVNEFVNACREGERVHSNEMLVWLISVLRGCVSVNVSVSVNVCIEMRC